MDTGGWRRRGCHWCSSWTGREVVTCVLVRLLSGIVVGARNVVNKTHCGAVTFSKLTDSIADDLLVDTTRLRTDAIIAIDPLKVSDGTDLIVPRVTCTVSVRAANGRQVRAADDNTCLQPATDSR